ncbi:MAG: ribosome small subunit-dependent GTPase A [Chloroflexi bacterium]|nr:ribosome small subunit-dependent GTPase A [Chloroflexota bacterium]
MAPDQPNLDPHKLRAIGKFFEEKENRGTPPAKSQQPSKPSKPPRPKNRGASRAQDWEPDLEEDEYPETFERYERRSTSHPVAKNLDSLPIVTIVEARGLDFVVSNQGELQIAKLAARLVVSGIPSPIVAGDDVRVTSLSGRLRIDGVEPRRSVLGRFVGKTDARSTFDPIAANLDLVVLVCSPTSPPFRPGLIDRYLTAAALEQLTFAICLNKTDLGVTSEVETMLEGYRSIGVTVFTTSAETGDGIDMLKDALASKISLFTGHSGVGKSTLLNAIEPDLGRRTGEITQSISGEGKGRHTTTSARLIPLSSPDTYVVDSPGIREFGLGPISPDDLLVGFPEIVERSQHCQTRHCLHRGEPGCAVEAVLPQTPFGAHRLASYRLLSGETPQTDSSPDLPIA